MPNPACPTRAALAAFAAGRLSAAELEKLAIHLETCSACVATLQGHGSGGDTLLPELRRARYVELLQREGR